MGLFGQKSKLKTAPPTVRVEKVVVPSKPRPSPIPSSSVRVSSVHASLSTRLSPTPAPRDQRAHLPTPPPLTSCASTESARLSQAHPATRLFLATIQNQKMMTAILSESACDEVMVGWSMRTASCVTRRHLAMMSGSLISSMPPISSHEQQNALQFLVPKIAKSRLRCSILHAARGRGKIHS